MKIYNMTPDGKGKRIAGENSEYSSLGWNHWHRVLRGRGAHEYCGDGKGQCEKCKKNKRE
jgi:hypothetical protein